MTGRHWLSAGPCPPGHQRHHLIPRSLWKRTQLASFLTELERDGLRLRRFADNGIPLPADERTALRTGHALHRGPHPAYTDVVLARVDRIRSTSCLGHSRGRSEAIARLTTLQAALRRALTDRHGQGLWLNRRDPMRLFADCAYLDQAITALFGKG